MGSGNFTQSVTSRLSKSTGLGLFRRWKGGDGKPGTVKVSSNSLAEKTQIVDLESKSTGQH